MDLCDGKMGSGEDTFCGVYDKKIFSTQIQTICKKIRFQQTGPNSSMKNYFLLSGIELFGKLFGKYQPTSFIQKWIMFRIFLIFFLLN